MTHSHNTPSFATRDLWTPRVVPSRACRACGRPIVDKATAPPAVRRTMLEEALCLTDANRALLRQTPDPALDADPVGGSR